MTAHASERKHHGPAIQSGAFSTFAAGCPGSQAIVFDAAADNAAGLVMSDAATLVVGP